MLEYIAQRANEGSRETRVSYREIQRALGYSLSRVRYACRLLAREGYVRCSACFDEDGGQRANVYTITGKGALLIQEGGKACVPVERTV